MVIIRAIKIVKIISVLNTWLLKIKLKLKSAYVDFLCLSLRFKHSPNESAVNFFFFFVNSVLGVFAYLRRTSASYVTSVCTHETIRVPLKRIFVKFDI